MTGVLNLDSCLKTRSPFDEANQQFCSRIMSAAEKKKENNEVKDQAMEKPMEIEMTSIVVNEQSTSVYILIKDYV